jgi:predicted nuclease of predicted toxin-antitoxin system
MDPILIDECLTPKPASVAHERGLVAFHVGWVGMERASDWDLAGLAAERDYIVVTNPVGTFFDYTRSSPCTTG